MQTFNKVGLRPWEVDKRLDLVEVFWIQWPMSENDCESAKRIAGMLGTKTAQWIMMDDHDG